MTLVTWLKEFLFWKFHWVWHDVGGTAQIIKKMIDFWKIFLKSSQCKKRINKGSWVSWTLVTWMRHFNLFYLGSFYFGIFFIFFTEFDLMLEERPELLRKWRISGKKIKSSQCKKCIDKGSWVSWTLVTRLRNYKLFFLEALLRLLWCRMNTPNYLQNDELLGSFSKFSQC